ncbi:PD-(D/E)XK nuclease family protein [Ligilactobacillus ceti]|uniref:ATP-dependent helicase/deoxyribonuclease subunit B n=1 Tax=Ligilactobacillus ceti DSM 22408 TaxID=1122146 RepID=A0A0R2KJ22_9LACO|nr:PD-(D/E)XK nuclease family protein [Ligilactobacillus ceti]KRN89360.1 atp-dependent deoxyribonuclease, subunit b [Ligilactobacillus ceti DSM 22408]
MALDFILGTASCDHQAELRNQLHTLMQEKPNSQFFYIVPDHIKFGAEVKVLDELRKIDQPTHEIFAANQVQIYSLTRLAWYFLKNEPAYYLPRISQAGLQMIVQRILRDHHDELTIFKGEKNQAGFVEKLVTQMLELKDGNVDSQALQVLEQQIPETGSAKEQILKAKLKDLQLVYREFEKFIFNKYLDNNDILQLLTSYLKQQDLHDYYFILDQMTNFTAQEMKLIHVLLEQGAHVKVSLVLDKPWIKEMPQPNDLFYVTGKTYWQLTQAAKRYGQKITNYQVTQKRFKTPNLLALEEYWINSINGLSLQQIKQPNKKLAIYQVDSRLQELEFVAAKIKELVTIQGYHYQDFMILTPKIELYQNILDPVLQKYEIPHFMDLKKRMSDHPLVELLQALLTIPLTNYRYVDVMRLLKTELLIPKSPYDERYAVATYREYLDLAENTILKFGLQGQHAWTSDEDWLYYRFNSQDDQELKDKEIKMAEKINVIKNYVKNTLPPFYLKLKKAQNGKEAAQILMEFLQQEEVPQRLSSWRQQALESGEVQASKQVEEVWQVFCNLLDEYVENLGTLPFIPEDFLDLLNAGFESATYSQVPSTLDEVLVTEMRTTQLNDRKITFLIGAVDTVLPGMQQSEQLLTDQEKDILMPNLAPDQQLAEGTAERMANESFVAYQAFMSSTQELVMTYPLHDDQEKSLQISPYLKRITNFFGIDIKIVSQEIQEAGDVRTLITTKRTTLSNLIQTMRDYQEQGLPLPIIWQYVYAQLQADATPAEADLMNKLLASLQYTNQPEPLTETSVKLLYGDTLNTSISKLEEFYNNQYAYFLKYGLKLQERDVFELTNADKGSLFHLAFEQLFNKLAQSNQDIKNVTEKEYLQYLNQVMTEILQEPQFQILQSTARMKFISRQLQATIQHMGWVMHRQRQVSKNLKTIGTEVLFGHHGSKEGLAPLVYPIGSKNKIAVRGIIDRVDQISLPDKTYIGLVDYKSSAKKFEYLKAYYGTSMQMLTYLQALLNNANKLIKQPATKKEILPAGALYMQIVDPVLNYKDLKGDLSQAAQILFKEHKLKGILLDDRELLANLDDQLEPGASSDIYQVGLTKKDQYNKNLTNLITQEELELLLYHNEQLIKAAGEAIFAGENALNPIRYSDQETALQYSEYKAIMQFDELLPDNHYRDVEKLAKSEILKAISVEQEEGE